MERLNTNPQIRTFEIKPNRFYPNSKLPVLVYKKVLNLPRALQDKVTTIQKIFQRNGWQNTWQNGIYDFHHYHSNTHECLAICKGTGIIILGGENGKRVKVAEGDAVVLPAGVSHKGGKHSPDFLCVGAYPQKINYDMLTGTEEEYKNAVVNIQKVPIPKSDPLFGKEGFLHAFWK